MKPLMLVLLPALLFLSHRALSQTFSSTVQLLSSSFNSTRQGNVLVSINGGASGAICDANWTLSAATVICRQLGFDVTSAGSVTAQTNSAYGNTAPSAVMTQVVCVGNEVDISHCPFVSTTANPQFQCASTNYAGVTCFGAYVGTANTTGNLTLVTCSNSANMQLVNGSGSPLNNGRLQVSQDGVNWGTVCSQSFTQTNAQVVCAALCNGVSTFAAALPGSYYGQGLPLQVVLSNVSCVGTESSILNCPSNGYNVSTNCTDAVGVNCNLQASQLPSGALTCGGVSMQVTFSQTLNPLISSIIPINSSLCQNSSSWSFTTASQSYAITVPYFDCGTTRTVLNDATGMPAYYVYSNVIIIFTTSSSSVVSRTSQFQMNLQCTVQRSTASSNSLQTGIVNLPSQQGNYSIPIQATITFYSDPGYVIVLQPPIMVQLSTPIYVQVTISQTAAALGYRVIVPNCVASPYSNISAPLYYLIQNNCINDSTTIKFTTQSAQLVNFMFYSFRFVGNFTAIYLQCSTLLCASTDFTGLCSGVCGSSIGTGRRKRDVSYQVAPQTMLSNGPLFISRLAASFAPAGSLPSTPLIIPSQSSLIDRAVANYQPDVLTGVASFIAFYNTTTVAVTATSSSYTTTSKLSSSYTTPSKSSTSYTTTSKSSTSYTTTSKSSSSYTTTSESSTSYTTTSKSSSSYTTTSQSSTSYTTTSKSSSSYTTPSKFSSSTPKLSIYNMWFNEWGSSAASSIKIHCFTFIMPVMFALKFALRYVPISI